MYENQKILNSYQRKKILTFDPRTTEDKNTGTSVTGTSVTGTTRTSLEHSTSIISS